MTFRAKYHVAAVALAVLGLTFLAAIGLRAWESPSTRLLGIACFLFIAAYPLWSYPHRYEIRGGQVLILAGLLTLKKVELGDIVSVKVARVWPPFSHLVWPTEGLRLNTKKGSVLLIPRDVDTFVTELHRQQSL